MSEQITYESYLKIVTLLDCQTPTSSEQLEVLFILVHQVFELWFKQVIADLNGTRNALLEPVTGSRLLTMNKQMERSVMIFKLVIQQFAILETMSPMEFMNFRGYLTGGSGFQSLQFRLIEIKLGVKDEGRLLCAGKSYKESFNLQQKGEMQTAQEEPTLIEALQSWLEKTPGLNDFGMDFVNQFREKVKNWLSPEDSYEESGFERILDEKLYNEDLKKGLRRLSWRAYLGALMIFLYREEPLFTQRCTLLQRIMDFEAAVQLWRNNHVLMVQRMIGKKTGTGGSSGVSYLHDTTNHGGYRVFNDLFHMATYFIPAVDLPPLTPALKQHLAFTADA